ncbi:MAG TPA: carboxypeptidase M32 [Candidatus Paceibacterota bacterium]
MKKEIEELKKRLHEISHLGSISALAAWDQEVNMPPKGTDARAVSISYLSATLHNKFIAIDSNRLLTKLNKALLSGKIKGSDAVIISETWRTYNREKKLPEKFVKELSETCSKAQSVWAKARKDNDFKLFLPWLRKIVNLKKQEAEYIGYKESPYDALLDAFEPGMTAREVGEIFEGFKIFLIPFLKSIRESKIKIDSKKVKGSFPLDSQRTFNEYMAKSIGFDFSAGEMNVSTHPFASGFHPYDVRLTTRYREDDMLYALGSTIHETGHGLYEQGLPTEHFGTPLCESVSLGIHESQSRMWENIIGKSLSFWKHFYPKLQKQFPVPFKKIPLGDFHKIINRVSPSLIRTEADEVTYNLHVILRFEIEKGMLEGNVKLENLPKIWKEKMKEYLDIDVPNNTLGVLQDVHWSTGGIGYFPTYSLGNLYSAQFYAQMKKDIPNLDLKISKGRFDDILVWLRKNIHSRGKTYKANDLAKKVTGEYLTARHWNDYIKKKYGEIYALS